MKKILMTLAAVLCCTMAMMVQTACSNEDVPVPEPDGLDECTILYYGTGGQTADQILISSLVSCYQANPESFEHVNFVGQYKFSTAENLKTFWGLPDEPVNILGGNTIRWVAEPEDESIFSIVNYVLRNPSGFYGDYNADLANPDSLTNFINWAAKAFPAKKYVVIIADHGGGYRPNDELPESTPSAATHRGAFYDDGSGHHFTAKSLARALRQAEVHVETLMFQACLMNNMEYQFELKDVCDYVVASTYIMQSNVAFGALIDEFAKSQTTEEALAAFCKATVEGWEPEGDELYYSDMTVTRTSSLNQLGVMMREFTDRLCETYVNGTDEQRQKIDYCTAHTVKVDKTRPSYDAAKYIASLMRALPEVYDDDFYNQFGDAFNDGLVAQNYSRYLTAHNYQVDYSILIGADDAYLLTFWQEQDGKEVPFAAKAYYADGKIKVYGVTPIEDDLFTCRMTFWYEDSPWSSTFADTYEQLEFDRIVGWSRWIKLNRQLPSQFCPHDLKFELPEGDVSDNPQL